MSMYPYAYIGRSLAALALALSLSAAAAAHPGGYGAGPGHPGCAQPPARGCDMPACPYAQGLPIAAPMAGKVLGVHISDLPNAALDASDKGYGVNVEGVQADSAAAAAGIRAGDLIVEFAGKPVLSGERLRWLVRKAEAGKSQEVKLMREGKPVTLSVTLADPQPKEKCDRKDAPRIGT